MSVSKPQKSPSTPTSVQKTRTSVYKGVRDVKMLWNKCSKPDSNELKQLAKSTAMGFAVIGGLGFVVKLIFIPINNLLLVR
ncbi:hypothetical protein P9112_001985 [Eukaryota sp. TZLM1-RC]